MDYGNFFDLRTFRKRLYSALRAKAIGLKYNPDTAYSETYYFLPILYKNAAKKEEKERKGSAYWVASHK